LDKQTLDCIDNGHIQRLKARLTPYNFTTVWKKGKEHRIPDALSRAPVNEPTAEALLEEQEIFGYISNVTNESLMSITNHGSEDKNNDLFLEEVILKGKDDKEYNSLLSYLNGTGEVPALYKGIKDSISAHRGLILFGRRLIIPRELPNACMCRIKG